MTLPQGKYKRRNGIPERLERTRLFHGMGLTAKEMAEVFDVSSSTVLNYLRELGLKPHRKNDTAGHRSVMTLELCERCVFKDCVWDSNSKYCPMEFLQKEDDRN